MCCTCVVFVLIVSPTLIIVTTSIELNEVSHKTARWDSTCKIKNVLFLCSWSRSESELTKAQHKCSSQSSVNFLPSLNVCEVKFNAVYHHVGLDTRGEEVCCPRRCPRLQEVYRPGREQREWYAAVHPFTWQWQQLTRWWWRRWGWGVERRLEFLQLLQSVGILVRGLIFSSYLRSSTVFRELSTSSFSLPWPPESQCPPVSIFSVLTYTSCANSPSLRLSHWWTHLCVLRE